MEIDMNQLACKFGELYYAELPVIGNSRVQQGLRPVLVISNNTCNKFSPVVSVIPLTSSSTKAKIPTHVEISGYGLHKPSVILAEQIMSIDKSRLNDKIGEINDVGLLKQIIRALKTQLNMLVA
jgi:mRNA interferase MazF